MIVITFGAFLLLIVSFHSQAAELKLTFKPGTGDETSLTFKTLGLLVRVNPTKQGKIGFIAKWNSFQQVFDDVLNLKNDLNTQGGKWSAIYSYSTPDKTVHNQELKDVAVYHAYEGDNQESDKIDDGFALYEGDKVKRRITNTKVGTDRLYLEANEF